MASKINADEFVDREGEGKPTLPKGVVLSGVTTITTAVVAENEVANSTGINAGIITSTHFAGNLTGDVNAGIVTVTSQSVIGSGVTISASGIDIGAGVITATSYAGSGANLTGIGATIMIWDYNPDPYVDEVALASGIGITFNQKIKAGSGNVTLRIAGAGGTVVENFGVGSSVTIAGNSLSFTPTSNLDQNVTYFVDIPSSSITNMAGDSYVGTGYTFQTTYVEYQLWGWGNNGEGNIGDNTSVNRSSPVQIPSTTWTGLMTGESGPSGSSAATKSDGSLWTWGSNSYGSLGQNTGGAPTKISSPAQVPGTTWSGALGKIITTSVRTSAIKTDGTLWSWGYNPRGALGHNNLTKYSSPVQVPGSTWKQISHGSSIAISTKTDGTMYSWGSNYAGRLGTNEASGGWNVGKSSPVQIPGTSWKWAAAGYDVMAATRTDGTLWGWGSNFYGALGLNQNADVSYSSPTQIPGTSWDKVQCIGGAFTPGMIASKTDGTLWAWGRGTSGRLAQNNTTDYSSPVQIPGTTWGDFAGAGLHTLAAVKTDGTLWAWGAGSTYGQLGQNASSGSYASSPVQVGTDTSWTRVAGVGDAVFGLKTVPSSA